MYTKKLTAVGRRSGVSSLLMATAAVLSFSCQKGHVDDKPLRDFDVVNLVANKAKYHPVQPLDPTLINGFGVAWSPGGTAWVNSVGGHVSELYSVEGVRIRAVNIPLSANIADSAQGFPCGVVFTGGKGFNLPNGGGASLFAFANFDGALSAWNAAAGNNAKFLRHPANSSYTGMAIASFNKRNFVYGANFSLKRIDAFDTTFKPDGMAFFDPTLPQGYSPYNVQAIGDSIYVVYAKLGSDGHPVKGAGTGFVSIFTTSGVFVKRLASRGTLNAPWGITMAPASFLEDKDVESGEGHGDGGYGTNVAGYGNIDRKSPVILVGNFGDGRINVFTPHGDYLGQLQSHKQPIVIEGLWSLTFPPAGTTDPGRLYFSAGPAQETDGVFGYLIKH